MTNIYQWRANIKQETIIDKIKKNNNNHFSHRIINSFPQHIGAKNIGFNLIIVHFYILENWIYYDARHRFFCMDEKPFNPPDINWFRMTSRKKLFTFNLKFIFCLKTSKIQ